MYKNYRVTFISLNLCLINWKILRMDYRDTVELLVLLKLLKCKQLMEDGDPDEYLQFIPHLFTLPRTDFRARQSRQRFISSIHKNERAWLRGSFNKFRFEWEWCRIKAVRACQIYLTSSLLLLFYKKSFYDFMNLFIILKMNKLFSKLYRLSWFEYGLNPRPWFDFHLHARNATRFGWPSNENN